MVAILEKIKNNFYKVFLKIRLFIYVKKENKTFVVGHRNNVV